MKFGIVTDSTSDISAQEAQELNIEVVPAVLILNGQEYLDGKGLSREDYYDQLPTFTPPPTTAAPSAGMFSKTYQKLFDSGVDQILSIHVTSTLSGIVNAAQIAAQKFDDKVQVIDSGQLSLGLGFQVMAAARAALSGSLETVQATLQNLRSRLQVLAMIDTLDQLKRSGRVNWMRSSLGSLLRIKLFLEVKNSQILRVGETRTRSKGLQLLSEKLDTNGELEQLAIVHTNALEDATRLAERFASKVRTAPLIRNVTTVVGTHVGVNAVGFISIKAE